MTSREWELPMPNQALAENPLPLSIIIITLNEAENLAQCLASLANIAAEVVVVDSGSQDGTIEIARSAGARVILNTSWPGFGPQKNIALEAASCDWVLSLDADERLTDKLRAQIRAAIGEAGFDSYEMPRLSYFCGKPIWHGGWYPDHVLRLFRRGCARFSDDLVHERVIAEGQIGRLDTPLLHYSYRTIGDVERKVSSYSDAGARQLFARGKHSSRTKAAVHGAWAFLRTYVFRRGFLDGLAGYRIAKMNGRSSYLKYAKLVALCDRDVRIQGAGLGDSP
jgi:glycosyltransferase involved in cell wall biosynthesis